jgi:RNA polymerase sigma-54 factor
MNIDIQQKIKINHTLIITPQLQQAIKILQLSKIELENFLEEQLIENPLLEEKYEFHEEEFTEEESSATPFERYRQEEDTYTELKKNKKQDKEFSYSKNTDLSSQPKFNYEEIIREQIKLKDHLLEQLCFLPLTPRERKHLTFLIYSLDDFGYLKNIDETFKESGYEKEELQKALCYLKQLDPPGVGSSSLEESLLLQLEVKDQKTNLLEILIKNHLEDLAKKNYSHICKLLNISFSTLQKNLEILTGLNSHPAQNFNQEITEYITPDIYLTQDGQNWVISLEKIRHGNLGINSYYASLVTSRKGKKDEKQFLRGKIKEAKWLIHSLEQREKTILRVVNSILEKQMSFFRDGKKHLKPMILKEIAEATGLHESTISRITNNKYIQTKHGLFELRSFFNSSLNSSKGSPVSSSVVKLLLSQMIKEEDKTKPLSDTKIQEKLNEKGIDIARRTVTKYREQLGFLSSSRRIRYH